MSPFSRRQFIRGSLVAATAAGIQHRTWGSEATAAKTPNSRIGRSSTDGTVTTGTSLGNRRVSEGDGRLREHLQTAGRRVHAANR